MKPRLSGKKRIMLCKLREEFGLDKEVDVRGYSPLTLAYIGDAVYDLIVRTYVVSKGNVPNKNLHNETIRHVSAVAQARLVDNIIDELSEEEAAVYRRGKNSKPSSMAKNASQKEYLKATGFEALIGYLFLEGRDDRIFELVSRELKEV